MRNITIPLATLLLCTGCMPLMFPMALRLPPEDQSRVDSSWENMFTPIDRIDRQTLLDCLMRYGLYQTGVDELHMKSIKKTSRGRIEMTIDFDKAHPKLDRFTVKVIGSWGRVLRTESWTGEEVFAAAGIDSKTGSPITHSEQWSLELERRFEKMKAATQPAGQ